MKTIDLFEEVYLAISMNKVRSGLTMLGIVIGIGSVVAMVSMGQGAQKQIESSIQSIGSNLIMVTPGFSATGGGNFTRSARGSVQTLTLEDTKAIESEVENIEAVAPEASRNYQIVGKGTNTNTRVVGVYPAEATVKNMGVSLGSFVSDQDLASLSKVAVLGPTVRNDLFGEGFDPIGQKIRINSISFTVIGVTESKGGTGFNNQDDVIYIPLTTVQTFLSGDKYISTINIQAKESSQMALIQEQVTSLLMERHNISDASSADFLVLNQADIVSAASSVTGTFTLLLAAIAGISLVVGGIGIMNMMLTTVTERTREIGLRKAIGAKNKDISLQFLSEAVLLTFMGGVMGVVVGWVASLAISKFAGMTTTISLFSVLLSFGVSVAIGICFGYYPATRAAKMNPIVALRYE